VTFITKIGLIKINNSLIIFMEDIMDKKKDNKHINRLEKSVVEKEEFFYRDNEMMRTEIESDIIKDREKTNK